MAKSRKKTIPTESLFRKTKAETKVSTASSVGETPETCSMPNDTQLKICLVAVENCGLVLKFIPRHLKTYEICLAAVKSHGCALRYVPHELKTEELCMLAVKQNAYALSSTPFARRSLFL